MTALLDSNVLIALVVAEHVRRRLRREVAIGIRRRVCHVPDHTRESCQVSGADGHAAAAARDVVVAVESAVHHEFWPDTVAFSDVPVAGVVGHRQVTDAYLAQLARSRNGQLATLDSGLAHLHTDVAVLIPTAS